MAGFFRVPAILFDRGIYPRCFGLSENAFRLYVYECACINNRTLTYRAGPKAARKYLGLEEDAYRAAKGELTKSKLVIRCGGHIPEEGGDIKRRPQSWCINDPPLVGVSEDGHGFCLSRPAPEPKTGRLAAFHRADTPHDFIRVPSRFVYIDGCKNMQDARGPLATLSVDEIYCYFNLLWQNREYWFGINPNYIRHDLSLSRGPVPDTDIKEYVQRANEGQKTIRLNPVFCERTSKSPNEIEEMLHSLLTVHKLLKWDLAVAQNVTYREDRRSIRMPQMKPLYYVDHEKTTIKDLIRVVTGSPKRKLIAQLGSTLKLDTRFETIVEVNRVSRRLSKQTDSDSGNGEMAQ